MVRFRPCEFEIDSAGRITLPLVGDFLVVDRSLDDVEQMIVSALEPEHLKNPQVSVEVIEYQNCYFIGEVAVDPAWLADAPPRSCRCAPGMRVIDLFKKCGWIYRGFTYRAVEDELDCFPICGGVVIMRDGKAIRGGPETLVMPGDVIELQERFF